MTRRSMYSICILAIVACLAGVQAHAQTTLGSILGSVTDSSGASIQQSRLLLTNEDEKTTRETTANPQGNFELLNLKPGAYSLRAEAAGFQTLSKKGLQLRARQTLRVDVQLAVGQITQGLRSAVRQGARVDAERERHSRSNRGRLQLSSLMMIQTGPYLTPFMSGGDLSGANGSGRGQQRPDAVGTISPVVDNPNPGGWWNRNAFVCPGRIPGASDAFNCNVTPIGRFGNAGPGTLAGPGAINVSMALAKYFTLSERPRLRADGSFTNLPNHPNFTDPSTSINSVAFGRVSAVRAGDSGGNRNGKVSLRLEF